MRSRRVMSLLIGLAVVVGIVMVFQWDARQRVARLQELMEDQGRAIADLVAESSLHGLATFNSWENEVNRRLANNTLWLVWLDTQRGLEPGRLSELAAKMGLDRILVFDAEGRLAAASEDAAAGGVAGAQVPGGFLEPLLSGAEPFRALGFRHAERSGAPYILAGAARPGGGAIVVKTNPDELLTERRDLGPGHLIRTLGAGAVFRYIVLQDRSGIQAASTGDLDYPLGLDEPFLAPLEREADWVSREYTAASGGVFEVSRKLDLATGAVWLRVGLDASLLESLRADTRHHAFMRLAVLLAGLLLVSALSLAWQKQGRLDSQVAVISAELRRHEVEARRREKLVAMGALGAGVAHQIRNPLNSIHMIAQMVGRTADLPDAVREQMAHVRDESARIEKIVQQFLLFAKPREPLLAEVDLAELVRDAVEVQVAALGQAGPTIATYAPGLRAEVDHRFVTEVLENLLRNAVHAVGPAGKILVSVIGSGDWAEIVVADNGPGVPPADRDRIFDLYYTTRPEGTGLGLSLAAQMVSAMGGTLSLAGEPGLEGRGARFVVRLPRRGGAGQEGTP